MSGRVSFNWVGLAVADLQRSRAFYEELLGFAYQRELAPHGRATAKLLRVEPPANLTAVYLSLDGFVLELLHFDRPENPAARERPMNEPGFTHLSVTVADISAVTGRIDHYGGTVLADTHLGVAVFVRDPDGQLIELLVERGTAAGPALDSRGRATQLGPIDACRAGKRILRRSDGPSPDRPGGRHRPRRCARLPSRPGIDRSSQSGEGSAGRGPCRYRPGSSGSSAPKPG
jgi:catechol 2,3-dioxygenase-like lactoylglutathione lyase family enzyme